MTETRKRVNLGNLMIKHQVTLQQLYFAGANGPAIWSLNLINPVDRHEAESVIKALNKLCNTSYSLDDIEVLLCSDTNPCHRHTPRIEQYVPQEFGE